MNYDHERAKRAVAELLAAMGYDVSAEEIVDTPDRVARSMREMTAGRALTAEAVLGRTFPAEQYDEVIALRDIPFYSLCEHHLLPFFGKAHVAYVPGDGGRDGNTARRVVGLSKLARLVDMHARRLQLQERMTASIAEDLERVLEPKGAAVIVEAAHLCMCSRGVGKPGSSMVTSVMRGCFRDTPAARAEVMGFMIR